MKLQSASSRVSAFAERVLRKLGAGKQARAAKDDGYRIGNLFVPAALARELGSRELVKAVRGGGLEISNLGLAYIFRRDALKQRSGTEGQVRPEPFAAQHQVLHRKNTIVDGNVETRTVNVGDTPLGWLRSRKSRDGRPMISQRQFEAGERLRRDFELSRSGDRLVQTYDGVRRSSSCGTVLAQDGSTVTRIAAKRRLEEAMAGVGSGLSGVVERVCCRLEGLEQAEQGLGWPSRSGKVVLLIGLDRLADHYRLPT